MFDRSGGAIRADKEDFFPRHGDRRVVFVLHFASSRAHKKSKPQRVECLVGHRA